MNSADMQGAVAEEVNSRLTKATNELQAKYESGKGGTDHSVDGPTGAAYKEKYAKEMEERKRNKANKQKTTDAEQDEKMSKLDDDDEENDGGDDEDYELRLIREQRLRQIKNAHQEKLENIGKGHGQLREITQDEFITEVTSSARVVCHFFHRDFPRSEIMNHHLQKLAQRHIETKFIKIDAEKAPFFVEKLMVRTIPTVTTFFDGVAKDKVLGFEGLADDQPAGKEDEWPTIRLARLLGAKGAINKGAIVDDEEVELNLRMKMEDMRKNAYVHNTVDDDDLDLSD